MGEKKRIFDQLSAAADLQDESLPGVPLVEIAGYRRVLVEHHMGVTQYSTESVCLKVKFGSIRVSGCDLVISKMSKDQLIISGTIESVSVFRGCSK